MVVVENDDQAFVDVAWTVEKGAEVDGLLDCSDGIARSIARIELLDCSALGLLDQLLEWHCSIDCSDRIGSIAQIAIAPSDPIARSDCLIA
jgi:hypothetical protein